MFNHVYKLYDTSVVVQESKYRNHFDSPRNINGRRIGFNQRHSGKYGVKRVAAISLGSHGR